MIHGLKQYPKMKDSAVPWLGYVPSHWKAERAKWLFCKMSRPTRELDEVVTCFRDGTVTLRKNRRERGFTESLKEIGYQGIRRGDLVIHAMDAFAGAAGVADVDGKGTPVYSVCEPGPFANSHYYAYCVREMARSQWIHALAKGIRERSTDFRFDDFGTQLVPLPPLDEQSAIVRFLDHADRRIRRYIRAKRNLIELLEEQRQAIIRRAVTCGLDPSVRLKSSGVEWVGNVPEHWEVRRAKAICTAIMDCKNRTPAAIDGGRYLVVRTTCIRGGMFDPAGGYTTDEQNFRIWTARGAPRHGDVFFTREAPAGEACLVPDRADLCMGQRMMYFRPDPELLDPEFLLLSVYGPLTRTYVELATNGSTVGHLRLGQVSALPILWCPVQEQRAIVRHVRDSTKGLEHAQKGAAQEIALLREYRTRLIADVVTGKLDVREVAVRLPDESGDGELCDEEGLEKDDNEVAADETDELPDQAEV